MNETLQIILVLVTVSVISAVALTLVYQETYPIIEENKRNELNNALSLVIPDVDNFVENEFDFSGTQIIKAYKALKDNSVIGYVFIVETPGFQNYIKILIGANNNEILGVKILEHLETPGLGSRITEDRFISQFESSRLDQGNFDAISGATISSEAVMGAIKDTQDYILMLIKEGKLQ